jgi:hypothetical protein
MREFMAGMMSALQNSPLAGVVSNGESGLTPYRLRQSGTVNPKRDQLKTVANATFTGSFHRDSQEDGCRAARAGK